MRYSRLAQSWFKITKYVDDVEDPGRGEMKKSMRKNEASEE
jgi:hypothetical protein